MMGNFKILAKGPVPPPPIFPKKVGIFFLPLEVLDG